MRIKVRRYEAEDRDCVMALATRLTEGVAGWRRREAVLSAVTGWVTESTRRSGEPGRVLLVATAHDEVVGFVSAEERSHWSGDLDVYVGELVVSQEHEGRGVGRVLMAAVDEWAGRRWAVRVVLETGAANHGALAFYERLGFVQEDVRLSKAVEGPPGR